MNAGKRAASALLIMLCCMALFIGCGKSSGETVTDRKIPVSEITEFYYTVENINYGAFYQRYRFYREDDKYLFYHETRERPDDYGPATEEDVTSVGTVELSGEDWKEFLGFLRDGRVSARTDSAESGSSGPWMFIYWKNDKGKYQVFEFQSYETRLEFEGYCGDLAQE